MAWRNLTTPIPAAPLRAAANTLRLRGARLQQLLDQIDGAAGTQPAGAPKRDYRRVRHHAPDLRIDLQQPGGAVTSLRYVCRDLSASGVGILHNSFIHLGTRCIVHLPRPAGAGIAADAGQTVPTPGLVSRCRLSDRGVHEIGIQFRSPLRAHDFLNLDPFAGRFSLERIDPGALRGNLLIIAASPLDRRVIRHMLQETGLQVMSAETGEIGYRRAFENFDLILCETRTPGIDGLDLVARVRAERITTPVVMLAPPGPSGRGPDPQLAQRARAAGASALLCKPLEQQLLLAALAEFMLLTGGKHDGTGPILSSLTADNPLHRFVPEFIDELNCAAARLSRAVAAGDVDAIRTECFQIMGAAVSLGLDPVGRYAQGALQAVNQPGGLTHSAAIGPIRDLIFACRRVRDRLAPA